MPRGRRQTPPAPSSRADLFGSLRATTLPLRADRLRSLVADILLGQGRTELADQALHLDDAHWAEAAVCVRAGWADDGLDLLVREASAPVGMADDAGDADARGLRSASGAWAGEISALRTALAPLRPPHARMPPAADDGTAACERLVDGDWCTARAHQLRRLAEACFRSPGPAWVRSMGLSRLRRPQASLEEARRCLWSCMQLPLPDGQPLGAVRLELTPEAMRQFLARFEEAPGWHGLQFARLTGDRQAVLLSAAIDGSLGGRPFRWYATCPLGRGAGADAPTLVSAFADELAALGVAPETRATIAEPALLEVPFGRGPMPLTMGAEAVRRGGDAAAFALAPACRHEGASWRAVAAWSRLWCPDCESELNCVPRHRMGYGPADQAIPMDARRDAFRALGDLLAATEGRGVPRSLEDVPGFGEAPPLDPAAYASAAPRPAARGGSLAQALVRGR